MNNWVGIGRLGRAPEVRYNSDGFAVGHFSIAIDRPKRRDGTKETDWIPVVVFGQQAENAEKYLDKGLRVAVFGRLQVSSYERDGQKRSRAEIVADRIEYLDRKEQAQEDSGWKEPDDFTF